MTAVATVPKHELQLRWCVYCGGRIHTGSTCRGHGDLPALERQLLAPADQWRRLRKRAA